VELALVAGGMGAFVLALDMEVPVLVHVAVRDHGTRCEDGLELAAEFGLPLALAHHIRPDNTLEALGRYRERFQASRWCERPRVPVSVETVAGFLRVPAHARRLEASPVQNWRCLEASSVGVQQAVQRLLDRA
jgi:hypothetical protein